MEVHHHPEVEKKGFKEYLLEGLMIFLAVFMGFIAENIREGISDRQKGKDYIRSFVQDLRRDTANFSILLAYDERKITALNGIFTCFTTVGKNTSSSSCLVPIVQNFLSDRQANFTDGTMEQLKNAGGLRLLAEADKDSILSYNHNIQAAVNFQATELQQSQDNVRNTYNQVGNFMSGAASHPDSVAVDEKTSLLITNDKMLLNKFFNDVSFYRRAHTMQMVIIKSMQAKATGIIQYFEYKYNLKGE
ncbi:MAG TPA: hypothetical protein VG367_17210 [Mucilaginibacter sp.]|jgi:hypothetical protein|nr:hypothetical protein [Mucilaginibacter sp.]